MEKVKGHGVLRCYRREHRSLGHQRLENPCW
jgi:hypothetical protein